MTSDRIFTAELESELMRHPKKWAALGYEEDDHDTASRILALSDTAEEAFRLAQEISDGIVMLYFIPDPSVAYYYRVV